MWKTRVRSLGQKDPLEKEMATLSSILALRIPWTEKSGRLQFKGSPKVRHDWATNTVTITIYYFCIVFDCLGKGKESSMLVVNKQFYINKCTFKIKNTPFLYKILYEIIVILTYEWIASTRESIYSSKYYFQGTIIHSNYQQISCFLEFWRIQKIKQTLCNMCWYEGG